MTNATAWRQLPVRPLPQPWGFRRLGEWTLAPSQGFAGRELKGRQGTERPPYSKPKAMWETPRNPGTNSGEGLGDLKRARAMVSRRRGS